MSSAPDLPERVDVVVLGAGPAGLATSFELQRRGVPHLVLERGDQAAHVWANLYDSLTLHTGRHMSGLPGRPIPRELPLFVPRAPFVRYLQDYARDHALPVRTGVEATRISRDGEGWLVMTSRGDLRCSGVVVATGIVSNPTVPDVPGRPEFAGQVLLASDYHRPSDVAGNRMLVVGVGNSGAEIASELAAARRRVDLAVRSGANVVPLQLFGVPIQYLAHGLRKLPRPIQLAVTAVVRKIVELRRGTSPLPPSAVGPLDAIPIIGFNLVDAIKAGRVSVRPGVERLLSDGAVFSDGSTGRYDAILLATGYRAALSPLGDLVGRDAKGFAQRSDCVTSRDQPNLWFVGHNYDSTGGLANIAHDAPLAAAAAERALQQDQPARSALEGRHA